MYRQSMPNTESDYSDLCVVCGTRGSNLSTDRRVQLGTFYGWHSVSTLSKKTASPPPTRDDRRRIVVDSGWGGRLKRIPSLTDGRVNLHSVAPLDMQTAVCFSYSSPMNSPVTVSNRQPPVLPLVSPSTPVVTTTTVLVVPRGLFGKSSFRYGPYLNSFGSVPVQA